MNASVENNTSGLRCLGFLQPAALRRFHVHRRDSAGRRSATRTCSRCSEGSEFSRSSFFFPSLLSFPSILLRQLKEEEDRPGCPKELPLTSKSISTTLGGAYTASAVNGGDRVCLSEHYLGQHSPYREEGVHSLEIQSRKQLDGLRAGGYSTSTTWLGH